jgi:anti-sigma-K factor RskA
MSDATIDPLRELLEEYALDLLDSEQRAAFEARLAVDAALRQELAATTEALATLAFSTPALPAPALKDRVMAQVAATPASRDWKVLPFMAPARRSRAPLWLGAALAASLVLIAKLALDIRDARREGQAAHFAAAASDRTVAQRDSLIAQLTDPSVELVTMAATGAAKPAIKVFLNRRRRTLFLSAASMETPPSGQAYQLWFIVDGKPVPSVTFRPDSTGRAVVRDVAIPAGKVSATAITREPEGGSVTPTMPILFVGKHATE